MSDFDTPQMSGTRGLWIGTAIVSAVGLLALLAPWISVDPTVQGDLVSGTLDGPSTTHWLGTDRFGRDVWSRLLHGGRISLLVGLGASATAGLIGVGIGAVSGFAGGWIDRILMRGVDAALAFPRLVLLIAVVALFEPSLGALILVIGLTQWPLTARLIRGEVLALKEREFVVSARIIGLTEWQILVRHILPNALPPVLVVSALGVGYAILLEAGLSFIGIGVRPPTPSWGGMIAEGRGVMLDAWWLSALPGLAIVTVVIGFNLIGDGLRARLDPKSRVGR